MPVSAKVLSRTPRFAVEPPAIPTGEPRVTRLIRLPEVMGRVGMKRSTIYRKMEEGSFPRSRSISAKCAVWVEAEIEGWIENIARGSNRL
jgi:prophage regulatory protein